MNKNNNNGSKSASTEGVSSAEKQLMTRVVLVRHGETDWNVIHRLQGVTDTNLTEAGRKQAERVAHRLGKAGKYVITHVYSSNLSRAVHTADEIVKSTKLPGVTIDKRFREFDIGIFAGNTQVS